VAQRQLGKKRTVRGQPSTSGTATTQTVIKDVKTPKPAGTTVKSAKKKAEVQVEAPALVKCINQPSPPVEDSAEPLDPAFNIRPAAAGPWVLIAGRLSSGFAVYGPFENRQAALDWAGTAGITSVTAMKLLPSGVTLTEQRCILALQCGTVSALELPEGVTVEVHDYDNVDHDTDTADNTGRLVREYLLT